MTVRFEHTENDWIALCDEWFLPGDAGRAWIGRRQAWGITAAVVLISVLERVGLGVLSFAVAIAAELVWRLSLPNQARHLYRRSFAQRIADVGAQAEVVVEAEGLRNCNPIYDHRTVWSRIAPPIVTPTLIVFPEPGSCTVVPRSAFVDQAAEEAFLEAARLAKEAAG